MTDSDSKTTESNSLHKEKINAMFSEITNRYDILNHVLSMGLDFWWRYKLVSNVTPKKNQKALDMAAGTLDVSIALLKRYENLHVTAGDICEAMMLYGQKKITLADKDRISIQVIDAQNIPFQDASFDFTTMAFGIRNVENRSLALKEMHRTLINGGQLGILEFCPIRTPVIGKMYHYYLKHCMPKIASLFCDSNAAYDYLAESVNNFPLPIDFCKEIEQSGFNFVQHKSLNFGIANLFIATKA